MSWGHAAISLKKTIANLPAWQRGLLVIAVPLALQVLLATVYIIGCNTALTQIKDYQSNSRMLQDMDVVITDLMTGMVSIVEGSSEEKTLELAALAKTLGNKDSFGAVSKTKYPYLRDIIERTQDTRTRLFALLKESATTGDVRDGQAQFIALSEQMHGLDRDLREVRRKLTDKQDSALESLQRLFVSICWFGFMPAFLLAPALTFVLLQDQKERLKKLTDKSYALSQQILDSDQTLGTDEIGQIDQALVAISEKIFENQEDEFAVLYQSSDVICSVDQNLKLVDYSRAAAELWAASTDDLRGLSVLTLCTNQSKDNLRQAFKHCSGLAREQIIVAMRAGEKTIQVEWSIINQDNGGTYFCLVRDLTAAMELAQVKDLVVAAISHDLRTPLNSLGISLNGLLDRQAEAIPPVVRERLKKIEFLSRRVSQKIASHLTLNRLKAGQLPLNPEIVSLSEFYRKQVKKRLALCEQHSGTSIAVTVEPDIFFECDPDLLHQTIDLLISLIEQSMQTLAEVLLRRQGNDVQFTFRTMPHPSQSSTDLQIEDQLIENLIAVQNISRIYRSTPTGQAIFLTLQNAVVEE